MPKISVIVPVYKVEKYLSRCVDSILKQSFIDFELILVDDGSPDLCGDICEQYATSDSRVVVIHRENGGLSAARNSGIEWGLNNSDSKWITFIDSDDWIHCRMLEIMYNSVLKNKTDIAVCDYRRINSFYDDISVSGYSESVYDALDFFADNSSAAMVSVCKLYRKNLFSDCRFPEGKLHEDVFTTYKLFAKADKISYINTALYFYYQNNDSIVHSSYSLRKLDEVEAGEEQVEFFKEKNDERNLTEAYKRLMYYYSEHTRKLRQLPEGKPYAAKLKRKLAWLLLTKAKACKVSIRSDTQYYETAFPLFMFFYWRFRKLSGIFSKKKS